MKNESQNVLLDVFGLENKGDWLMFDAMLEQVRKRRPLARIGVPENVFAKNEGFYLEHQVVPVVRSAGKRDRLRMVTNKAIAILLRRNRPMCTSEIDLVLFAPGFRFSDQFGTIPESFVKQEYEWFSSFTKPGRKIFFMPQAFGPLESEAIKHRLRRLLTLASRVFPRDKSSYDYLLPLASNPNTISTAPDFTCLFRSTPIELPYSNNDYVVVVPNHQMLVRTKGNTTGNYCEFMFRLVRMLRSRGEHVVLLNHEQEGDSGQIEMLNAAIDNSAFVVENVSGGACKSVIKGAKLVVTSRFHALVSALAEGTSVLSTSWSHKYRELVAEMDSPDSCLNLESVDDALHVVDNALAHPEKFTSSPSVRAELERKVTTMWDEILPPISPSKAMSPRRSVRPVFYIRPRRWNLLMKLVCLDFR